MFLLKLLNKIKLNRLKKNGLRVGKNFSMQKGVEIDSPFPWLISIGNNVTLGPRSMILSHDGSTKKVVGYTKVGIVRIDDNVFIGANSTILSNTTIGKNCIIGANSVVSGNIPADSVVCGNPAKILCSVSQFKKKHEQKIKESSIYDVSYTKKGKITKNKKIEMQKDLNEKIGYIV